ncbi:MAG: LCP family protein [Clostridia bacterium]|nr:LCP family protein [Clostridia bacterium]
MSNNNGNDFFSTSKEYNPENSVKDNDIFSNENYKKYLSDIDDGEEIVKSTGSYDKNYDKYATEKGKKSKKKASSSKKIVVALICVILAILIGAGSAVGYFFHISKPGNFNDNGIEYNNDAEYKIEEDDHDFEAMGSVTDAASLNEYLRSWANNKGEKMYSKNVLNVLLVGVEHSDGSQGRSDSMILVSVNRKAKTVTLSSFFRDSYIYMDIPLEGGGTKGRYEKINASYMYGGPATLIDTIEKNYKIEIDQYVMVDFASFKGIIDAVGGVDVDVEKNESDFIRRTSKQKNFPSGKKCHLNGTQALIYSRIRYLDSDVNRTGRQRKVIKSLIDSAKGATKGQLVNAYKKVAKYLRTGYTQSEVLSLVGAAVAQDWMSFEINEITLPAEQGVEMMSTMLHPTSSPNALQWVWIVDYPLCAQKLQLAIYGESNIILKEDRDTALTFLKANNVGSSTTSNSSSGLGSGSTYSYKPSYTPSYTQQYTTQYAGGTGEGTGEGTGGETPSVDPVTPPSVDPVTPPSVDPVPETPAE